MSTYVYIDLTQPNLKFTPEAANQRKINLFVQYTIKSSVVLLNPGAGGPIGSEGAKSCTTNTVHHCTVRPRGKEPLSGSY